jgi:carboxypeptidase C (cathepsin A)
VVPWTGVKALARRIEWKHQEEFSDLILQDESKYTEIFCTLDECNPVDPYGNTVELGNLKYVRIFHAGHMPMERQGVEVRDLFYKWMAIDNGGSGSRK